MNCLHVEKNNSLILSFMHSNVQTAGSTWFLNKLLNLKQFKSIYQSFLFFLQVLNLDILTETREKASPFCTKVRGSCALVYTR